jgi:hypothetical protein
MLQIGHISETLRVLQTEHCLTSRPAGRLLDLTAEVY